MVYSNCTNHINTVVRGENLIVINYNDKRPIYEQIVERVKNLIFTGILEDGEQLPSVRSLAMELSTNPNTVQRAYAELEREGVICCVKGRGNFVCINEKLWAKRKKQLLDRLKRQMKECQASGIEKSEIEQLIIDVYKEATE